MEDKKVLDIAKEVAKKTIGFDLTKTKVDDNAEVKRLKQLLASAKELIPLKEYEYITESYNLKDKTWHLVKVERDMKIDESKEVNDYLTKEDYEILESKGFNFDEWVTEYHGTYGIADRDDNILILRSSQESWWALAGREYYYYIKEKELKRHSMN